MAPQPEECPMAPTDLRQATLLKFMKPEFEEFVVAHALNHRSELPNDVRRKLDSSINAIVKIPQFPNQPAKAPASLLKQPIIDQLLNSQSLANAVLQTWFFSQETLYAVIVSHLHTMEVDVDYPDFISHQLRGTWSFQDWTSARDSILTSRRDLDGDDVALMLCFATGKKPTGPEDSSEEGSRLMNYDILDIARGYLEQLPADAPEWSSDIPDFLMFVSEIMDAKRVERESLAVGEALSSQISELMNRYSKKVDNIELGVSRWEYLELDISSWVAPSGLTASDASKYIEILRTFSDLIEEYFLIPKEGPSVSDTRRLRSQQDKVLERIQELKEQLDHILISDNGRAGGPYENGEDSFSLIGEPKAIGDAALSGINLSDGELDFSPTKIDYHIEMEDSVNRLVITPVAVHEEASIDVAVETPGDDGIRSLESDDGAFVVASLNVGQTVIRVNVTTGDSDVSATYTLNVTRAPSKDATLIDIVLSVGDIDFDSSVNSYRVDVDNDVDSLSLNPIARYPQATIHVNASDESGSLIVVMPNNDGSYRISPVSIGETVVALVVTAEDNCITQTYTVTVARAASNALMFQDIESSAGDLDLPPAVTQFDEDLVDGQVKITAEEDETTQSRIVVMAKEEVPDLAVHIWPLVAEDDLAGAYWLARSTAAQGVQPPVAPLLLKAVQGARLLSPDTDNYVEDLFEIEAEIEVISDDDAQVLLRLAAGLLPSLIAPRTNLLAWLLSPRCLPSLEAVVLPLRTFASTGHTLSPELIKGDEGFQHLQGLIIAASEQARQWLREAPDKKNNFTRAVQVWQYLCREGILNQMLTPVSGDRREAVNSVQDYINRVNRDTHVEIINQAEISIGVPSNDQGKIVGNARVWLGNRIDEAEVKATDWCNLVTRLEQRRSRITDNWLHAQVSTLRTQLQGALPSAFEALLELGSGGSPPSLAASATCAARSLEQLAGYLNLEIIHEPLSEPPAIVHDLSRINSFTGPALEEDTEVGHLEIAVSRRLLWVPSVAIDDSGLPLNEDSLVKLGQSITSFPSSNTLLEDAIKHRMGHHDFRFFDLLATGLPSDKLGPLKAKYSTDLGDERKTLEEAMASTRDAIERAANDGVIEFEGARWYEFVNTLEDVGVEEALNFNPIHDLLERITRELNEERMRRREELIGEWHTLTQGSLGDTDLETDFFDSLKETFDDASCLDSLDIRVMEYCFSRVRDYRPGEEVTVSGTSPEEGKVNSLEELLTLCSEIESGERRG